MHVCFLPSQMLSKLDGDSSAIENIYDMNYPIKVLVEILYRSCKLFQKKIRKVKRYEYQSKQILTNEKWYH